MWLYAVKAWSPVCKETLTKLRGYKEGLPESHLVLRNLNRLTRLGLTALQDRRMRGDLIETFKVLSNRKSIDWVKPLNLRKNVDISEPASSVRGNSLSMRSESFSSRVRYSFCSWATMKDNFFVNMVVQTWNSLPNNIVASPSLNAFKSSIDEHFKIFGCYSKAYGKFSMWLTVQKVNVNHHT